MAIVVNPPIDANYRLLGKHEGLFEKADLNALLSVPRGWGLILGHLSDAVDIYTRAEKFEGFRFLTVAERSGELFIDYEGANPQIEKMVKFATKLSRSTCTKCGEPGTIMSIGGRPMTLCEAHALVEQVKE